MVEGVNNTNKETLLNYAIAFWVVMLVGLIVGGWGLYPFGRPSCCWIVVALLFIILGLAQFGAPLHK